jgi:hypothetical protein
MRNHFLLSLIVVMGLTGCQNMSDRDITIGQGAAGGAALGGITCALAGGDTKTCFASAAGGAVVGGGAGYLVAQHKQRYANDEQFLDGEIAQTSQLNDELAKYNRQLEQEIANIDAEIADLRSRQGNRRTAIAQKRQLMARIRRNIAENNKVIRSMQAKVSDTRSRLQRVASNPQVRDDPREARLRREVDVLADGIQQLKSSNQQIAHAGSRLRL